jgi:putative membrane protein
MNFEIFPRVNASLNATSAACLALGYFFIKRNQVREHVAMMISALITSAAFLVCYLTYHAWRARHGIGVTHFPQSSWRPLYLTILTSHTILAVVILPLIFLTLWRATTRRFDLHKRISVITLPLWFYVSVTGVVVYWMLYHLAPTLAH